MQAKADVNRVNTNTDSNCAHGSTTGVEALDIVAQAEADMTPCLLKSGFTLCSRI